MVQISLEEISKTFKIAQRPEGRFGFLKGAVIRKTKRIHALDHISFQIAEGELVGYIGPNGAGKSTTVKIMSGILTPESGHCEIMGRIPWKDRIRHVAQIGVVFGQRSQLWWDVPVRDSFDLLKDIYDIPANRYRENLKKLVETMDIGGFLKTPGTGSCRSASACAARWSPPCCISPKYYFWTTYDRLCRFKIGAAAFLKEENAKTA